MAIGPAGADNRDFFDQIDPSELEHGLTSLMQAYQHSRSALRAWLVVRYAEALYRHPAFEGSDEQRCVYHRLARQWRWLATAGDRTHRSADGSGSRQPWPRSDRTGRPGAHGVDLLL